jgi:O-antigen/teichoic acid export membrane protein
MLTFVVHDRSEVLLIGALSSAREVAFYSVALRAAGALMSLGPWIVATIFFPLLAADWARGDRRAMRTHYAQYVRYLALAAAPLALGGLAAADVAVALLYGPAYAPMVPVIRVTLLAVAVAALADAPTAVLAAAERQDWLLRVQAPLAIANVLLDIALIPSYGALGAGLATLAVSVASAALLGTLAWRLSGAALPVTLALPFLAAAIIAALVSLTLGALPDGRGLGISLVAAAPIYLGILALLRFFRADDAEVVAPLLGRLPLLFRPGMRS